ncbi:MAG TPA: hypothetical protein VKA27_05940 [Sunxiuqinia sp.]|nr:hypothetical protein [Sunxiuqinia sp.]
MLVVIFGQLPVEERGFLTWQEFCEKQGDDHPEICPECGKKLIHLENIQAEREKLKPKRGDVFPLKFLLAHCNTVCYDGICV